MNVTVDYVYFKRIISKPFVNINNCFTDFNSIIYVLIEHLLRL